MRFSDLARWDVAGFGATGWNWPDEAMQPLGSLIQRISLEVDGKAPKKELPIIGKITFGGDLSLSDEDERQDYKGRLFWASAGQLVYSKIRVKQGSFCFVPNTLPLVAVSAEYPVYEIDANKAEPAYIDLLLRSAHMKAVLEGLSHGGGTKTRIHPEQFEALVIPVLPLVTQRAIVAQWQKLQANADVAEQEAELRDAQGQHEFLQALGLLAPAVRQARRAFCMRWSEMGRWGSESNRLGQQGGAIVLHKFPTVQGTACIESVSHGCSVSPSALPTKLEVLKISAVTRGWLNTAEKKYAPDQAKLRQQYALRTGDVLLCRTNGTLDYVGRAALVEGDHPDLIFPDKVIRVRLKDQILPAFFWYLLGTPYLRAQIESFARTAVGNYAIGGKDIWKFQFPLPPLDVQQTLITAIGQARADALALRQQAKQLREQAKREIEAALLGKVSLSL